MVRDLTRRNALQLAAVPLAAGALGIPNIFVRRHKRTGNRVQREFAVLGSDGGTVRRQSDDSSNLLVGVRLLYPPESGPFLRVRLDHGMGMERRPEPDTFDRSRRRNLARRVAVHRRRCRMVAGKGREARDRKPDTIHLVENRQLQGRRQPNYSRRSVVRTDDLYVDGLPDRLRHAESVLRESRAGRIRSGAGGNRPLHGRKVRAKCVRTAEGPIKTIGAESRNSKA